MVIIGGHLMEERHMIEKLENHEKRLTTVEILQDYQAKEVAGNKDSLKSIIVFNHRMQIALALCLGAYLSWEGIVKVVSKFIGG